MATPVFWKGARNGFCKKRSKIAGAAVASARGGVHKTGGSGRQAAGLIRGTSAGRATCVCHEAGQAQGATRYPLCRPSSEVSDMPLRARAIRPAQSRRSSGWVLQRNAPPNERLIW